MKKRAFEKLLREAIILEAEEQGARLAGVPTEPVPEEAQARFNASLKTERQTAARETVQEIPVKQESRARRIARGWMTAGIAVVTTAALIFVIGLMAVSGISKGTKAAEAQPAEQQPPEWTAEEQPNMPEEQPEAPEEEPNETSAPAPGAAEQQPPEPGEPLPNTRVIFADENAAIVAMMRFYEENRTLLMAVSADLKAPEHGYIVNGVVYSINGSYVDRDHPYASMTDSIKAFLDLPDSVDYVLFWNDSIFHVSLRWTNDSGYYSTNLVFAEDGQKIVMIMYEKGGTTLEPVYEDSAWGVYTVCWQTAPFHAGSSYAPEQAIGVWETDIYDYPSLYLELFDDGTARILDLFGDYDIRAHYAWDYDRDSIRITFSDQTVVRTAELHINTDTMTLTLADGNTVEATRAEGVVLPLFASDTGRARNTVALPAVCPAYALGTSKKETVEGILFRYDLDGDGTEETISFRQSPEDGDTPVIISIDETEYPLAELDARDKVSQAILIKPDPASGELALVVTTNDIYADWNRTAILLLRGKEVRKIKAETNDAYAYPEDGTLRITARCWLMGTYYGSRAYAGAELEPASEWYETGVLDRVKDMTREEQIEFNDLFEVVRDLPCTIDGKPAVIEAGTWMYLLRWKDTDDFAELETEDGRIITVAFTPEYDQYLDGTTYVSKYLIDGIDAESYFENLCMAG